MATDNYLNEHLQYLRHLKRTPATAPLLRGMAMVLSDNVDHGQLRTLAHVAGGQIGAALPLSSCTTIEDFEAAINAQLLSMDWGWVRLEVAKDHVSIVVGDNPLTTLLGASSSDWAPAILEGLFAEWLRDMGATQELDVRQVLADELPDNLMKFRLAHVNSFSEQL
ncbi:hypothetical protein ATO7_07090 [Oceanococcus atlanticus]|uniref:Cellulose synthase operon protein D n=1 Tax=Oceanococcus atlanticus TaxID=1317117 RepID=A0A1Y1SIZ4_9GAMM|nr:cellulose biosynthesis protein BcsD [Oceanococcus atlanticus]ORE89627.1 hypothetical protein ATO7_07090 [Oceanococcus atlanticus]